MKYPLIEGNLHPDIAPYLALMGEQNVSAPVIEYQINPQTQRGHVTVEPINGHRLGTYLALASDPGDITDKIQQAGHRVGFMAGLDVGHEHLHAQNALVADDHVYLIDWKHAEVPRRADTFGMKEDGKIWNFDAARLWKSIDYALQRGEGTAIHPGLERSFLQAFDRGSMEARRMPLDELLPQMGEKYARGRVIEFPLETPLKEYSH